MIAVAIPNMRLPKKVTQKSKCKTNLQALFTYKNIWAVENNAQDTPQAPWEEYIGDRKLDCPAGGSYSLNPIEDRPTCSIHGGLQNSVYP